MPSQAPRLPAFWCTHCGKKFTRKEHLERHIPHHTGHKPYTCDQCFMSFGRQDLLRRHQAIYHSLPDGLDPIPSRAGSHKPDVACSNCHRAKCLCDKQKPSCGSCIKKGITCVPRESKRLVKQETRAGRSAAPLPPAPPAQLPLPALPASPAQLPLPPPDEHNQQEPVMEASLEAMIDADAYQRERRASEAQLGLQQGTSPQSSFMSESPLTGNLAPGGPFSMNGFDFTSLNYEDLGGYGNPIQSFNPKDANFGSQNNPFLNMSDQSRSSSIGIGFDEFSGITDFSGFAQYGGFAINGNTHHSLADHHEEPFKHFGQNDGSSSALHRDRMPQQMMPKELNALPRRLGESRQSMQHMENSIHSSGLHHFGQINDSATFAPGVRQQGFPQFEPNHDRVISLPSTPQQDFGLVPSYGLPSPAKTIPSPPPSGCYAQLEGDKPAATSAEFLAALKEKWIAQFGNPHDFENFIQLVLANQNLIKKSGIL